MLVVSQQFLLKFVKKKKNFTYFKICLSTQKAKRGLELVCLPHFLQDLLRKIFLSLHFINWLNLIDWLPFLLEILGNVCIVIICCSLSDVIILTLILAFLSSRISTQPKSQDKSINIVRKRTVFNMK